MLKIKPDDEYEVLFDRWTVVEYNTGGCTGTRETPVTRCRIVIASAGDIDCSSGVVKLDTRDQDNPVLARRLAFKKAMHGLREFDVPKHHRRAIWECYLSNMRQPKIQRRSNKEAVVHGGKNR